MELKTVKGVAYSKYTVKGSKFLGYVFPISNLDDFSVRLPEVKKEHPKATHHCFAYRLGIDSISARSNDDGEPRGSAGKPILNQLLSYSVSNVLAVVVRYYGGTNLGIPGLIDAYKTTTQLALDNAELIPLVEMEILSFTVEHSKVNKVLDFLSSGYIAIIEKTFSERAEFKIRYPKQESGKILDALKKYASNLG